MKALGLFDKWARFDAERHVRARELGQTLKANLPGPGVMKVISLLIGILILNEIFFSGLDMLYLQTGRSLL